MNNIKKELASFSANLFQEGKWNQQHFYEISDNLSKLSKGNELASGILSQQLIGGVSLCLRSHLDGNDTYAIRSGDLSFDPKLGTYMKTLGSNVPAHLKAEGVIDVEEYTPSEDLFHKHQDEFEAMRKYGSDSTGLFYYGYRYYQPWVSKWMDAGKSSIDELATFHKKTDGLTDRARELSRSSSLDALRQSGSDTGKRHLQQPIYKAHTGSAIGSDFIVPGDHFYLNSQYQDYVEVFDQDYNKKGNINLDDQSCF